MEVTDCIKSALKKLEIAIHKKFSEVKNFRSQYDQNKDFTLQLDVGAATHLICSIRTEDKVIIIRSESSIDGLSSDEQEDIGAEIAERINAKMTAYDDFLVIMKPITFPEEEDSLEKLIFNEVMAFIQTLTIYQPKLNGENQEENASMDIEEEEDPFGFNSLSLDDGEDYTENDDQQQAAPEKVEESSNAHETADEKISIEDFSVDIEPESEEAKRLNHMLKEFENEEPLNLPDVDVQSLVEVPEVIDLSKEELPTDIDILKTADTYHGPDQYGLIQGTRNYKDAAQKAIDQIHELLASLYAPVYKMSIELYGRNDELTINERNVQQTLDNLSARQKKMDEMEAQLLAQQQSILRDRANFNKYTDSVRNIIADYDVKCRTVSEQADELRLLQYDLTKKTEQVDLLQRQLDAVMGEDTEAVSKEYANALIKANEKLQAYVSQLKDRLDKYYKIIDAFRDCQKSWEKKEAEYKKLLKTIDENGALSEKAKEEINQAKTRIAELEVAVVKQQQLAEKQSAIADEQRARADLAETKGKKLREEILEKEKIQDDLERRAKTAEAELANEQLKYDVTHTASIIKEQLAEIGADAEPVPGEGEMVLHADFNGCLIAVDCALSIIYINKAVKKPQKYGKLLDELNTQDIRTSYNISGKDIVCRSMFSKPEDVAVQADKILTEMAQFR